MKVCFDTSALVAALLVQHPQHPAAFARLQAAQQRQFEAIVTTHGLAESFATLTALPLRPRLRPGEVERMLQNSVLAHFKVRALSAQDYSSALDLVVAKGFGSGAIYDALHLIGARTAGCDQLLTLNLRHFEALAPGDPIVAVP